MEHSIFPPDTITDSSCSRSIDAVNSIFYEKSKDNETQAERRKRLQFEADCRAAIKILTQSPRIHGKENNVDRGRRNVLSGQVNDESITYADIVGSTKSRRSSRFNGKSLKEIRELCGYKSRSN
ncbi:hypothetical protein VQ643_15865 [Pseudomonas sp. F1_0610]|uniref:hypothetical protein n=1 Tax=Pseudomonas sp. F1_0610 TaxID=3114284 RepID=UPI0039C20131